MAIQLETLLGEIERNQREAAELRSRVAAERNQVAAEIDRLQQTLSKLDAFLASPVAEGHLFWHQQQPGATSHSPAHNGNGTTPTAKPTAGEAVKDTLRGAPTGLTRAEIVKQAPNANPVAIESAIKRLLKSHVIYAYGPKNQRIYKLAPVHPGGPLDH